jgi:hypothetical protein
VTSMNFIGLDIHKKTISYCVKDAAGEVLAEGTIPSTRQSLDGWMKTLAAPWTVAMEATMFTGWIYDHLLPHAFAVKVAHPLMLRAIAVAKKKNDRIDASKIADCLRCNFLPECYMASTEIRERRRTLRYRKLLVRQNVQLRNKGLAADRQQGPQASTDVLVRSHQLLKVAHLVQLLLVVNDPGLHQHLRDHRADRQDGECAGTLAGPRSAAVCACGAADDDPGSRSDHRPHLGARGG